MARTVHIDAGAGYDVHVGSGLLRDAAGMIRKILPKAARLAVFTDTGVGPLYADPLEQDLRAEGFTVVTYAYPAGERHKNLETVSDFLDFLSEHRLTRRDAVVVLGGGVAGDMGGFAASIYLRGIPFVQIPTTLLAAVDSSVGGKTGVDTKYGKNLTGSFWQPSLVVYDTDTFSTLGRDQILDGTAEIIKTAAIRDAELFRMLEETELTERLEEIVSRCVEIKGGVVAADEKESGLRRILNFGHTLGHAIERVEDYGISHGKAVAVGMVLVTRASERAGQTEPGTFDRLHRLLRSRGFRTDTDIPMETLCEAARSDKKSEGDAVHIIYLEAIGRCADRTVAYEALPEYLRAE